MSNKGIPCFILYRKVGRIMFNDLSMPLGIQTELILRIILSCLCGCLIGFERKNRKKEAGIRTHIIVALASCLMMEVSKFGFSDCPKYDASRVAAQIVSGVGFLGAGMIFVYKNSIKGLTTAAGIWATSGIGMALGAGMYVIGIVTALIVFFLQIILHKNFKFLRNVSYETLVFTISGVNDGIMFVRNIMERANLGYENISISKLSESRMRIEIATDVPEDFDMYGFIENISSDERIISLTWDTYRA